LSTSASASSTHRRRPRSSSSTTTFAPHRKSFDNYPYIVAGHNLRGRLLLCASQGPGPNPKAYILCDAVTCRAVRLPDPAPVLRRSIVNPANAFLFGDNIVVKLQPPTANTNAALLCYRTGFPNPRGNGWFVLNINYPPAHRPWGAHGTTFHDNKIWWLDLSHGLLYADFKTLRKLSFVALPPGSELQPGTPDLDKRRCVGVSAGALRYVRIHRLRGRDGKCMQAVSVWTLIDDETTTGKRWRRDCRTPFQWIWDDDGYKNTKLKPEVPAVALFHPNHGGVVYFLQKPRMLGVDVLAGRVLEWQYFTMLHPPLAYHSLWFIRAWELGPAPRPHAF
ncbi:hypothetical protein BAE44_0005206, partial [Dichanthelium oligosanthes]